MKIWRTGIACWIPETINIHSEYNILIVFPLQRKLHERCSLLRYSMSVFPFCTTVDGGTRGGAVG